MKLQLVVGAQELVDAVVEILPMRLYLGKPSEDDRPWFQINSVRDAMFIPQDGLRITCAATVHYPLPVLPDEYTVLETRVVMQPRLKTSEERGGGPVLAFMLGIEDFDIKYVPRFVDDTIAAFINKQLRDRASTISWNFTKTFTRSFKLPERMRLVTDLLIRSESADLVVSEDAITLTLNVGVSFEHDDAAVAAAIPKKLNDGARGDAAPPPPSEARVSSSLGDTPPSAAAPAPASETAPPPTEDKTEPASATVAPS